MATVLLADAHEDWRALTRALMEERGVDVAEASTVEEALRAARVASPRLVVVDLMLPDGRAVDASGAHARPDERSASDLARDLRALHPGIVVVCLSTVPRTWVVRWADPAQFDAVVPKLCEPDVLLGRLLAHLGPPTTRRLRRLAPVPR